MARAKLLESTRVTTIAKTMHSIERIEGQTRFLRIAKSLIIRSYPFVLDCFEGVLDTRFCVLGSTTPSNGALSFFFNRIRERKALRVPTRIPESMARASRYKN